MSGGADIVARSDRGRVRNRNEDAVAVDEGLGVAVLADGMGGLRDGHVASREAVQAALDHIRGAGVTEGSEPPTPVTAVRAANRRVLACAADRAGAMGTTAVVMQLDPRGRCRIAHVGDSRAYRLRQGALELLTRDHSMVQELVDSGLLRPDQARDAPNRNVITRAVGLHADLEVDATAFDLAADDLVLLCSDGLWDMLDDRTIQRLLADCAPGRDGLQACADRLVNEANAAGGMDNVSVVLARR